MNLIFNSSLRYGSVISCKANLIPSLPNPEYFTPQMALNQADNQ